MSSETGFEKLRNSRKPCVAGTVGEGAVWRSLFIQQGDRQITPTRKSTPPTRKSLICSNKSFVTISVQIL